VLGITDLSLSGAKTPHFRVLFYDTAAKRAFRRASKVGEVAVFRVGYATGLGAVAHPAPDRACRARAEPPRARGPGRGPTHNPARLAAANRASAEQSQHRESQSVAGSERTVRKTVGVAPDIISAAIAGESLAPEIVSRLATFLSPQQPQECIS
jgi:hypothetical protein